MLTFGTDASEPDSLMGAILVIEGIEDAVVLLNGPTGCKTFYGWISNLQYPRSDHLNPGRFLQEFYFGQARVPTTYLDEQDYVFGGSEKLERIFDAIAAESYALIGIVNSPGAALIAMTCNASCVTPDLACLPSPSRHRASRRAWPRRTRRR